MNQLEAALDFLKKMGLPQKDVSSYMNVPESTLSYKKKNCMPNDALLLRIESTFEIEYNEEKKDYVALNTKELFQRIKNYTYGKAVEYIGTHWYMYFPYVKSYTIRGLGKAVIHIWEQYKVEIKNLPDEEGRVRDYFGTFELDKTSSYLIFNLFDAYNREKYLHAKFAIGVGSKPTLAIGHYSNIGESHKLDAKNAIIMLSNTPPKEMKSECLLFGTEAYKNVDIYIRRFLGDKDKNCLRIPQTIIKSHQSLKMFFERYDIERRLPINDSKLKEYVGDDFENPKEYYLYYIDSATRDISSYNLKMWLDYEQGKNFAELKDSSGSYPLWEGEVLRYETCLNIILKQEPSHQEFRYAFLQTQIPDKVVKKTDFMQGFLTGMEYTGMGLLSFRVLIFGKGLDESELKEKAKYYFDLVTRLVALKEQNGFMKIKKSLTSNFEEVILELEEEIKNLELEAKTKEPN